MIIRQALLALTILASVSWSQAQGLIVNELSNGTSGSKEFFEFVVIGTGTNQSCGPVDIRGYLVDDNNGDFACGPCASTGIATGHFRFSNVVQWSAVPVGSIIIVYNDIDVDLGLLPAADPDDTSPHDSVYVVPSSHASIEFSTTAGCTPNVPFALNTCLSGCTGNAGYAITCYASNNDWGAVNLRNAGDACQIRLPGGAYYHGFAYGTPANNMAGGPDGLINPITGTNLAFFFANTGSNDYRNVANWASVTAASATPGVANNAANLAWINFLRTDCPLPIEYASPLAGEPAAQGNKLTWSTLMESNCSHFVVTRAQSMEDPFEAIGMVMGSGNSQEIQQYRFTDTTPYPHTFYRLEQVDFDGAKHLSNVIEISFERHAKPTLYCYPNPAHEQLKLAAAGADLRSIQLIDATGRLIHEWKVEAGDDYWEKELRISDYPKGIYFLNACSARDCDTKKVVFAD